MKRIQQIMRNWHLCFVGGILLMQAIVFLIFRENSYLAVHDNLDLFVTQLKMLKDTDSFFAQDVMIPMLGGISRDNLGSEFSLYNILYYILPNFWAYLAGYALKIIIGIFSFCLLAKDVYGEKYVTYKPLILVIATAFALIPVFPAYGICFASMPLIVFLLRRIYIQPNIWLVLGVFLYPLVSYFSYFGFFILAFSIFLSTYKINHLNLYHICCHVSIYLALCFYIKVWFSLCITYFFSSGWDCGCNCDLFIINFIDEFLGACNISCK